MSILSLNTVNEQSGIVQSFGFDTAPEDMHILYYIARNQLYSDELLALLREYGVNAMDIHIATGQAERPIRVTLPTQLDSFLKIRDFGTGLDSEGIKEYAMFGRSSKRGDPLQTGQLGIGCKCGFTYGDSFLVNSYQNGVVSTWNAYIDPSNKGKIDCLAVVPTDEPNGIEVIIPVRPSDINKCHERAMKLFSFSKVTPEFVNQTGDDIANFNSLKAAVPLFQGEGWRYMGTGDSYAVMGNIPYPIDGENFTELEMRPETKSLLEGGLILDVKLDALDFAASREQLKYTPKTKANLSARLSDITNELMKMAATSFDGCKTLWDAKQLYKSIFDFHGKLYHLRNLFIKGLKFNGFPVNSEDFSASLSSGNDTDVVCHRYIKPGYGRDTKVRKEVAYQIKASPDSVVLVNDTGICNGILNRIVPLIEGPAIQARLTGSMVRTPTVYLLSFRDDATKQAWIAEVGYDGPMVSLATCPKEPLNKYYPTSSSGAGGYKNSKHTSREFTYDGDGKSRYHDSRSAFWEIADVDLANDEGVYVQIERFHFRFSGSGSEEHPIELHRFLEKVKAAGIDVPDTVYGFKPSSAMKATSNPKMVPLWKWFEGAVAAHFQANPQFAQDFANRSYVCRDMNSLHAGLRDMLRRVCKWPSLPAQHPLRDLLVKVDALCKYDSSKMDKLEEVAGQVNYTVPAAKPVHDISADYKALAAKYPLLFKIDNAVDGYELVKTGWNTALEQYVLMVDTVTP